jgi:hypothetical protein
VGRGREDVSRVPHCRSVGAAVRLIAALLDVADHLVALPRPRARRRPDRFNSCATWGRLFLVAFLVNLKNRSRMLAIGG